MVEQSEILAEFIKNINSYYHNEQFPKIWYQMFYKGKLKERNHLSWVNENYQKFLEGTPNDIVYNRWLFSEMGAITTLEYSPNGSHIIVGHSSGLIQMRHGSTGTVLCTLRNVQFPPKPVYALEYSKTEERVCYAACMDGAVYRIEIPHMTASFDDPPDYCIRVDPALECLNMQYYGAPGISSCSTPHITQRSPALSLGITADQTKMIVGYADTCIKLYDMETQNVSFTHKSVTAIFELLLLLLKCDIHQKIVGDGRRARMSWGTVNAILTYKVHKLRLQFIPKKLQRIHFGQVCALRCHPQKAFTFASGAWDKTLRIWDTRCKVGCVMTFEGVDICSDSIDLNRDQCIAGSWQPTEALTVWDLVARKKLNVIRVQNRRPDVDGEYIYACRYWHSNDFNRKGKYGIIGGSGTNCVEVINLHNRYITCSYPAAGTVLAVTSFQDRIAFGGTAPIFNIVSFHDPKHEKDMYQKEEESEMDYLTKQTITVFEDTNNDNISSFSTARYPEIERKTSLTVAGKSGECE